MLLFNTRIFLVFRRGLGRHSSVSTGGVGTEPSDGYIVGTDMPTSAVLNATGRQGLANSDISRVWNTDLCHPFAGTALVAAVSKTWLSKDVFREPFIRFI